MLTQKGVLASMIFTSNEILMTELIISHRLDQLDLPAIAAVLSVFSQDAHRLTETEISTTKSMVPREVTQTIDWLLTLMEQKSQQFSIFNTDLHDKGINVDLVDATYLWAKGCDYFQVLPYLEERTFDGNFIRSMLKLSQIADELVAVAQVAQNAHLEKKMIELKTILLRDIVSFDSLYVGRSST